MRAQTVINLIILAIPAFIALIIVAFAQVYLNLRPASPELGLLWIAATFLVFLPLWPIDKIFLNKSSEISIYNFLFIPLRYWAFLAPITFAFLYFAPTVLGYLLALIFLVILGLGVFMMYASARGKANKPSAEELLKEQEEGYTLIEDIGATSMITRQMYDKEVFAVKERYRPFEAGPREALRDLLSENNFHLAMDWKWDPEHLLYIVGNLIPEFSSEVKAIEFFDPNPKGRGEDAYWMAEIVMNEELFKGRIGFRGAIGFAEGIVNPVLAKLGKCLVPMGHFGDSYELLIVPLERAEKVKKNRFL